MRARRARIQRLPARRAGLGPPGLRQAFQVLIEMEAERLVFPFELEPAAELGRLGQLAVVMRQEQLWVVLYRYIVGVGQRVVAEQVAQPQDHRIDVGDGAAVPDQEDIAVADLKQLALEFPQQPVELARRDAQLIVAPVVRLQPRQMEMDRVPVEIVALQPPDEGEQLGLDLLVLGCLHDRPERSFPERLDDAHERPNHRTVVSEFITTA